MSLRVPHIHQIDCVAGTLPLRRARRRTRYRLPDSIALEKLPRSDAQCPTRPPRATTRRAVAAVARKMFANTAFGRLAPPLALISCASTGSCWPAEAPHLGFGAWYGTLGRELPRSKRARRVAGHRSPFHQAEWLCGRAVQSTTATAQLTAAVLRKASEL